MTYTANKNRLKSVALDLTIEVFLLLSLRSYESRIIVICCASSLYFNQ